MSVGPYDFVQGMLINAPVTLTEKGSPISGGISVSDVITAYVRFTDGTASETDTVDLGRPGTNLAESKIIISFTDSADWPTGRCELVIFRNNLPHHDGRWEVIPL